MLERNIVRDLLGKRLAFVCLLDLGFHGKAEKFPLLAFLHPPAEPMFNTIDSDAALIVPVAVVVWVLVIVFEQNAAVVVFLFHHFLSDGAISQNDRLARCTEPSSRHIDKFESF